MEKNYIVYKLFFRGSNKCYIGITNDLERRLQQHLRNAKLYNRQFTISKAIRKYGNPEYEILEIVDNSNILLEKEKYYIGKYDSYNNGYNGTLGGQGSFGSSRKKSLQWRKNHSSRMQGKNNPKYGKKCSEEWKKEQSVRMKDYYENNPQKKAFGNKSASGMKWINNGIIETKILKECDLPENFTLGRLKRNVD